MDAVANCTDKAPADAFEPEAQWTFMGPPGYESCIVMPLVGNLTDDNGDGEIDLCDVPAVVVIAGPPGTDVAAARLYVLDGATGAVHYFAPGSSTPARRRSAISTATGSRRSSRSRRAPPGR